MGDGVGDPDSGDADELADADGVGDAGDADEGVALAGEAAEEVPDVDAVAIGEADPTA